MENLVPNENNEFYNKAQKYWSEVPPTVNGMLGGMGYISSVDIQASKNFLRKLKAKGMENKYALDCGAGIGRVSKYLLMPMFDKVDLVEQDASFAEKAKEYCTSMDVAHYHNRLGTIYNVGLQEFTPAFQKYDVVWSQWVLGHLTDKDLVSFFLRVRSSLCTNGYFIIKENVTSSKEVDFDETDSSVTRPLKIYEKYLKESGFSIVQISQQKGFPRGLYPVYMIACQRL